MSHDRHVLEQLPEWFREDLPFRVTSAGSYVDRETLDLWISAGCPRHWTPTTPTTSRCGKERRAS